MAPVGIFWDHGRLKEQEIVERLRENSTGHFTYYVDNLHVDVQEVTTGFVIVILFDVYTSFKISLEAHIVTYSYPPTPLCC